MLSSHPTQNTRYFWLVVVSLLFVACEISAAPAQPQTIVILGAKLIDGTGAPPIEDSVVIVRENRIVSVGRRGDIEVPAGSRLFDASGKVVMPGLVDLHCHYGGGREVLERRFALQLAFGVTTARSLGGDSAENMAIITQAKAGKISAPRLYMAGGGFSHPSGMPPGSTINRPTTASEAREMVRQLVAADVDLIKMWVDPTLDGLLAWGFDWNGGSAPIPQISAEIRTALVREAAKHGIGAVAHIYEEQDVRQLNSVGVRHFVHTVRSAAVDDNFVQWAKQQGLSFAPALSKAQDSWYLAEQPEALEDKGLMDFASAKLERLRSPETQAAMLANPQAAQLRLVYSRMLRFIEQMNDANVTIAVGSDSGAGNVAFGWGTHHEMKLLVEDAGLTPLQALTAATGNGARILEGEDAEFGTIEAGQIADLLVLSADPMADISNSRQIERVMQGGQWLNQD